eukprot:11506348-Alexandrium_andersonii.AAC.1
MDAWDDACGVVMGKSKTKKLAAMSHALKKAEKQRPKKAKGPPKTAKLGVCKTRPPALATAASSRQPTAVSKTTNKKRPGCLADLLPTCRATKVLRVASDCTGLNSGHVALELCGVEARHLFGSDKDCKVRAVLAKNFPALKVFSDCTVRDHSKLPKDIDLYTAGFPCQSFSTSGSKKGVADTRGMVLFAVLETIKATLPR